MVWTQEHQLFVLCDCPGWRVVFRKTVVGGDWRFDYLSGSHLLSQVKSFQQLMVIYAWLVVFLIGQFCWDVIGWDVIGLLKLQQLVSCCFTVTVLFYSNCWERYITAAILSVCPLSEHKRSKTKNKTSFFSDKGLKHSIWHLDIFDWDI